MLSILLLEFLNGRQGIIFPGLDLDGGNVMAAADLAFCSQKINPSEKPDDPSDETGQQPPKDPSQNQTQKPAQKPSQSQGNSESSPKTGGRVAAHLCGRFRSRIGSSKTLGAVKNLSM